MKRAGPGFGPEGLLLRSRAGGIPDLKGGQGRGKEGLLLRIPLEQGQEMRAGLRHCWARRLPRARELWVPEELVPRPLGKGLLGEYGSAPVGWSFRLKLSGSPVLRCGSVAWCPASAPPRACPRGPPCSPTHLLMEQDEPQQGPGHRPLVSTVFEDNGVHEDGHHLGDRVT